jgi:hypothetical protein
MKAALIKRQLKKMYDVADVPTWVDKVYDSSLLI